jgi:hypothetical protein
MNLHHREKIKAWPVCMAAGEHNAVLMSDGSLQYFRSYGRAQSFLEHNPAPTAREQVQASLWAETVARDHYRMEEEFWNRQWHRDEEDSE